MFGTVSSFEAHADPNARKNRYEDVENSNQDDFDESNLQEDDIRELDMD